VVKAVAERAGEREDVLESEVSHQVGVDACPKDAMNGACE
jgi:hypothetical protein